MVKECFIDTETTGNNSGRHGLIEIAVDIEYDNVCEAHDLFAAPFPSDEIDPNSCIKHGYYSDDMDKFPSPDDTYNELVSILDKHVDRYNRQDKFFMIGYGVNFDSDFLRAFFRKNGDEYFGSWFFTPAIDVMSLAGDVLKEERHRIDNFKLHTVAEFVGIDVDRSKLHGAEYDCRLAKQLYRWIQDNSLYKRVKSDTAIVEDRIASRSDRINRMARKAKMRKLVGDDDIPF